MPRTDVDSHRSQHRLVLRPDGAEEGPHRVLVTGIVSIKDSQLDVVEVVSQLQSLAPDSIASLGQRERVPPSGSASPDC